MNKTHFNRLTMILTSTGFLTSGLIGRRNAVNFADILYLHRRAESLPPAEIERIERRWYVMSILRQRDSGNSETSFDFDIRQIEAEGLARYVESFNGKLWDELLNREILLVLEDTRWVIDRWHIDYNHRRGHSALDYQTPAAFAANCVLNDSATLLPSEHSPTTEPGSSHSRWYKNRGWVRRPCQLPSDLSSTGSTVANRQAAKPRPQGNLDLTRCRRRLTLWTETGVDQGDTHGDAARITGRQRNPPVAGQHRPRVDRGITWLRC